MSKIAPCLWFNGQAEEAANFYVSIFPDAAIDAVSRYGASAPFPSGTALMVQFWLAGQRFQRPYFLAGGLDPWNVTEAIAITRAPLVDVSSGVERGAGLKDAGLIASFLEAVRRA